MESTNSNWAASSADPSKMSATIEGVLTLLVSVFGGWLSMHGYTILPAQIQSFSLQIAMIVVSGTAVIGVLRTAYGLLRKVVVKTGGITPKV